MNTVRHAEIIIETACEYSSDTKQRVNVYRLGAVLKWTAKAVPTGGKVVGYAQDGQYLSLTSWQHAPALK